jgi:ABC-type branched-subunit amino acid transport system ATPase component
MLQIDNLRAGYGSINVLWDVSIHIPSGRLTTILGPNGAGKTTLLRAIMGIVTIAQGEIRKDRTHQIAASLSGGEAQMIAMGRGLMSAPQTILIDGPSLGLAPVIVHKVFAVLEQLKVDIDRLHDLYFAR